MYLGKVVVSAPREEIFDTPLHPYTKALFSSVPIPDPDSKKERLIIKGEIPSAISPPPGCRFNPRCPYVFDRCRVEEPDLKGQGADRLVACHLYDKGGK